MKRINLGAVKAAPSSTKPAHASVVIDNPDATALLTQWVQVNPQFKTLKNTVDTLRAQLAPHIKATFFSRFSGIEPESSTMLCVIGGKTVKLITKNAYSKSLTDDAQLQAILGADLVARHFHEATVIKLDLDKCPADRQEAFAQAIIAAAKEHGAMDAITASQCIQPVAGFHEARTRLLTPEQNIQIDALLPIVAYPQL